MQSAIVFAALLFVGVTAESNQGHPIAQVITLLDGLKAKAIKEGKQEEAMYAEFKYWCKTSIEDLGGEVTGAIAVETEKIAGEELQLASLGKKKESLSTQIARLTQEISDNNAAQSKADDARKKEADDYKAADDVFTGTITAIGSALKAMTSAATKTEAALLQQRQHVKGVLALISTVGDDHEVQALESFADPMKSEGDKAAHVDKYDFKSEKVVELLKKMQMKTQDESVAAAKAETDSINSHALAKQSRAAVIAAATKAKNALTGDKGEKEGTIADVRSEENGDLSDKERDTATLKATRENCNTRATEWAERSKTRTDEIAAMDSAMAILAKASGVRHEKNKNPKMAAAPVFLQLSDVSDPKMKAVALIRQTAKEVHSKALERLAQEVQSHLSGPFDKINQMVQKMIFRLMEEQKKEDEHKLWCDKEISKSDTMKEDKTDKLAALNADIASETAKVGTLTDRIGELREQITKTTSFMAESTEIRETGKMENAITVKDAKKGATAIANAVAVLNSFYKGSGGIAKEAWEFVQQPVSLPKQPAVWESALTGTADPQSVIIAVLEQVGADFAKLESETMAEEASDQKEYDTTMKDNKIAQAGRAQEVEMKEAEKKRRSGKLNSLTKSKKDMQGQLDKTNEYIKDLGPACRDGDSSYTERKALRDREAVALRSAQETLTNAFKAKPKTKFLQMQGKL